MTEDIEGASLAENYRKRIPWGTLTVDVGAGYSVTNDETKPGLNTVVNESQTLADTVLTFLNNPNVVLSSVVVTNLSGAITYLLNVDYILIPHGILTEIQRLPTGAIPNATTVLVSYQFQSDLPIKYGTRDLHGRVTLDLFDHLTLYLNRQSTENTVLSGTNMGQLQNLEETLFGSIVRWEPATSRPSTRSTTAPWCPTSRTWCRSTSPSRSGTPSASAGTRPIATSRSPATAR